jgi:hypothetical protein
MFSLPNFAMPCLHHSGRHPAPAAQSRANIVQAHHANGMGARFSGSLKFYPRPWLVQLTASALLTRLNSSTSSPYKTGSSSAASISSAAPQLGYGELRRKASTFFLAKAAHRRGISGPGGWYRPGTPNFRAALHSSLERFAQSQQRTRSSSVMTRSSSSGASSAGLMRVSTASTFTTSPNSDPARLASASVPPEGK